MTESFSSIIKRGKDFTFLLSLVEFIFAGNSHLTESSRILSTFALKENKISFQNRILGDIFQRSTHDTLNLYPLNTDQTQNRFNDLSLRLGQSTQNHMSKALEKESKNDTNKTKYHFASTRKKRSHYSPFADPSFADGQQQNKFKVLIILNRPVMLSRSSNQGNDSKTLFQYLWENSSLRICADGGANRLYSATSSNPPNTKTNTVQDKFTKKTPNKKEIEDSMIPDLIIGDLDSVTDEVRDYYNHRGCSIFRDSNQYINDLDKALQTVCDLKLGKGCLMDQYQKKVSKSEHIRGEDLHFQIFIYGAFGGRFDQSMASIQALYKWTNEMEVLKDDDLILYTEETSARILHPGVRHVIEISPKEGPACGLIPIGGRCDFCWSNGLQWNLDETMGPLEFGGLVSTSNIICGDCVEVECSRSLVWTTEMRGFADNLL